MKNFAITSNTNPWRQRARAWPSLTVAAAILMAVLPPGAARAQTLSVIYDEGSEYGELATGLLIHDNHLFGATRNDEVQSAVYSLSIPATGLGTFKVVHEFIRARDGQKPSSQLIADQKGNLYGTTLWGGTSNTGTVYELIPTPKQPTGWGEIIIANCNPEGCDRGLFPREALTMDADGALYGVTQDGGPGLYGCGMVFKLVPPSGGSVWTYIDLYEFQEPDGDCPQLHGGLLLDSAGNLYGTTASGGAYGHGAVFELSPTATLPYTYTSLYDFEGGADGASPNGALVGSPADLWGTTASGGSIGGGVLFELVEGFAGNPAYTLRVWHSFTGGSDGYTPTAGLLNVAGTFWGTTSAGGDGTTPDSGTIFKLAPDEDPLFWDYTTLYTFNGPDGADPGTSLTADASGTLYGVTLRGGTNNYGVVYKLVP